MSGFEDGIHSQEYENIKAPAFVLDVHKAVSSFKELQEAFDDGRGPVQIWYALKSNPHPALVRELAKAGCGFEVASQAEVDILDGVTDLTRVPFTNPVKISSQIDYALNKGLNLFTVDNPGEVRKVAAARTRTGITGVDLMVRIAVSHPGSLIDLSGKFGAEPGDVLEIALEARRLHLGIRGVSFHVGSQALNPAAWSSAVSGAAEAVETLKDLGYALTLLDMGGGFPVEYDYPVPTPLTICEYAGKAWDEHAETFKGMTRALEPGRFLSARTGCYRANVIGVAVRDGKFWIHTDIGAYNGPNEAMYLRGKVDFPITAPGDRTGDMVISAVTGPTCDPEDTIRDNILMPNDIIEGDIVEIPVSGSYSHAVASSFNGFAPPPIIIVGESST